MNTENIGKLIRELRKEKGWTQKELALKLHVTDKAVSKWERGKSMPDFSIIKNSKNRSFSGAEIEVLTKNEKDLKMKTSEEMLQFAKKYQKAEFKQYRLAFDEIEKGLHEDEYAVFSMVGEDYIINESIGMNYSVLAVTNSRVLIGGESIRGRLLTRYIIDAYELSEIHSVRIVNHKIVLKTSNAEIKIEGKHLESVAEKLKEVLSKKCFPTTNE